MGEVLWDVRPESSYQRRFKGRGDQDVHMQVGSAASDAVKPSRLEKSGKMDRRLELGGKRPGGVFQDANEQRTRQSLWEVGHASVLCSQLHNMITSQQSKALEGF